MKLIGDADGLKDGGVGSEGDGRGAGGVGAGELGIKRFLRLDGGIIIADLADAAVLAAAVIRDGDGIRGLSAPSYEGGIGGEENARGGVGVVSSANNFIVVIEYLGVIELEAELVGAYLATVEVNIVFVVREGGFTKVVMDRAVDGAEYLIGCSAS